MTALEAGVVAADAHALADFYTSGMGFTLERVLDLPQGTVLRLVQDDARLKIFQPVEPPEATGPDQAWNTTTGFSYAALHVDDASRAVDQAVAAGATVVTEVTNHRPGAWFALIEDPDGNIWEILQED
ncbi:MAG: VOC family protein [Acidimicrobiales bacterium]